MNEFDLLENARDTRWDHNLPTPHEIRTRGNRRATGRRASGVVAAAAFIATAYAVLGSVGPPSPEQVATGPTANALNLNGAEFDLPPDWQVLNRPSAGQVCVGDATQPTTSCPVRIAVADEPSRALVDGLDVVPDLMSTCEPNDPRFVEVAHETPGTSTYSGRCTADSPAMTAWSFDSRTLYVLVTDVRWAPDGADIFNTVNVPANWPKVPAPAGTESATPASPR